MASITSAHPLRLARRELVGTHAPERIARQHGAVYPEVTVQRLKVSQIVFSGVAGRVVGIPMPALVGRADPPVGRERVGERGIGRAAHPVRVQRDQDWCWPASVEVGQLEAVVPVRHCDHDVLLVDAWLAGDTSA